MDVQILSNDIRWLARRPADGRRQSGAASARSPRDALAGRRAARHKPNAPRRGAEEAP